MKLFAMLAISLFSLFVYADQIPAAVSKAAVGLKNIDTRTVISPVVNTDRNPCLSEGKSYNIDLQVKQASWDPMQSKVIYTWQTVKTVNSDLSGKIMEVCAE